MRRKSAPIGNKQVYLDIGSQGEQMRVIAHALSSDLRIQIIQLLGSSSKSVNELAAQLQMPMSTISTNLAVLERAGLIRGEAQAGAHGTLKLCSRVTDAITLSLLTPKERSHQVGVISMPIGGYSSVESILPTCGLAGREGYIGIEDNPQAFYLPGRLDAQLIWIGQGYLEYRFPAMPIKQVALESVELSFEVCSEAVNYRLEWPSDISLWINGVRIGSWLSPGDFGGRRGVLNPDWWTDGCTQYGHLLTWRIDAEGSFADAMRVSGVKLEQLQLAANDFFTVRIGVDPQARHVGGMNLFGQGFGDYRQDIVFKYTYH